ncbi:MAG: flagellar basal body rod protein FlgB [Ignavibacteria bacterium]|nr:flagellar basal body rod protein FlgB [Ignavibacteria bacterium]
MAINMLLFKERLPLMHKALDAYSLRLTTTAENIANVNSVGYSPKRVIFEEYFKENISQLNNIAESKRSEFLSFYKEKNFEPRVVEENIPKSAEYFSGQSHVNIDKEMAELAETQIRFRFVSRLLKRYFAGLNSAITGFRES